jgi:hypothetical protein
MHRMTPTLIIATTIARESVRGQFKPSPRVARAERA